MSRSAGQHSEGSDTVVIDTWHCVLPKPSICKQKVNSNVSNDLQFITSMKGLLMGPTAIITALIKWRTEDYKFETDLGYMVNTEPAQDTQWDLLSKQAKVMQIFVHCLFNCSIDALSCDSWFVTTFSTCFACLPAGQHLS